MPTNFRYKFLSFFGSDGSDLNFTFDETTNIWSGTVNIPTVSVNLYESTSIFILEQFLTPGNMTKYGIPHISTSSSITTSGSNWVASWEDDNTTDLKLFQFNPALDKPEIQVVNELEIPVDFDHAQTFDPITGQIITNKIDNKALQINVALSSELEDIFQRVLVITEQNTSTVVAKITFYGETIADDERLNNELVRLGFNVGPEDYPVFRDSDVEEIIPDAELLNAKKKEMLREGHNIKPFIGSYKGLINAIKFYGYNDITLREFWLNVDVNSVNYGKYKLTDVINLFTDSSKRNDDSITLPNNIFKKTNLFSLVYKINEETGFYNADDLPITQPTSQYTFEEVLIKLYGLKNILKKKYLSGNAKIVDIVGEGEFFGRTRIAAWSIGQQIDKINVGIYPSMTVSPDPIGYIQDLRTLESLLFPAATPYLLDPKLTLDSTIKASDIANVLLGYFTKYHPGLDSVAKLEDKEGIPAGYPIVLTNTSFNLTWDQMDITWDQLGITGSLIIDFEPGNIGTGDTFTIKDNQSNQFVSYTTHFGDTVETIVNNLYSQVIAASTIGDGRPWSFYAVSKQDTIGNGHFNVIRFKQIFSGNIGVNLQSTTIGSFGGSPTLTKELITGNTLNTWDNIGIGNFYELEWVIRKPADLTPEYFYSIRGDIGKLNTLAIALPYTGSYSVELILYDTFNQFSSAVFNNAVTVLSKNIEICGFYKFREKDYTWNSIGNITWDEYTSNWELPIVPVSKVEEANVSYESLDRSNYILNDGTQDQRLSYSYGNPEQPGGPDLYTPGPYTWDNLGDVTWDELYHLSWDDMNITGDTPANFRIYNVNVNSVLTIEQQFPNSNIGKHTFTTNDLGSACNELIADKDPVISKYIYNKVYKENTGNSEDVLFIQAVAKKFGKNGDWVNITWSSDMTVLYQELSGTHNPTYNNLRFINDSATLPKCVHITFTYDKTAIPGKQNPVWTIYNNDSPDTDNITFEGKWLTYMFKRAGRYTIGLSIQDSNGNQQTLSKNMVIIQ